MKRSYNIKCAVNVINVSRAILTYYTTPDLLAIACRPVQRSPNSFRHIITVVIELCPTSYYQSLDSKSNELCFPHEVLVLPELSLQVKNEDYMVPVLLFPSHYYCGCRSVLLPTAISWQQVEWTLFPARGACFSARAEPPSKEWGICGTRWLQFAETSIVLQDIHQPQQVESSSIVFNLPPLIML